MGVVYVKRAVRVLYICAGRKFPYHYTCIVRYELYRLRHLLCCWKLYDVGMDSAC